MVFIAIFVRLIISYILPSLAPPVIQKEGCVTDNLPGVAEVDASTEEENSDTGVCTCVVVCACVLLCVHVCCCVCMLCVFVGN